MANVLMFHRILPEKLIILPNAYFTFGTLISLEYFETVLSFLVTNNFEFVTISELADRENSSKLVALTFDDGYSDNFIFVISSLLKFNAKATFFPVVSPCKENSVLPLDIYYQCVDEMALTQEERLEYIMGTIKKNFYLAESFKQEEILKSMFKKLPQESRVCYMNAEQLKQLSNNGFEIGSHGMTHSLLTANYMNKKKVMYEMQKSKEWLETVINKQVFSFCFPAGCYNVNLIELAKLLGYTSTCLVERIYSQECVLPSYDRVFVRNDSLVELKKMLEIQ